MDPDARSRRTGHWTSATVLVIVAFTWIAPGAVAQAPPWCSDSEILADVQRMSRGSATVPDILVDLRPRPGCDEVDSAMMATGAPATCSIQAAIDWIEANGDPTPEDGTVIIAVTGREPGGESKANLVVTSSRHQSLLIAGCQTRLVAANAERPVVTIENGSGEVAVVGIDVAGSNRAGFQIDNTRGSVAVTRSSVNDNSIGISVVDADGPVTVSAVEIADTRRAASEKGNDGDGVFLDGVTGGITIVDSVIRDTGGDGIDARRSRNLELKGLTITTTSGHGVRAEDLSGANLIEGCTIFETPTDRDGLRMRNSVDAPGEIAVRASRFANIGGTGVFIESRRSAPVAVTVERNSIFEGIAGSGVFLSSGSERGTGSITAEIRDATFARAAGDNGQNGIDIASSGNASVKVDIDNVELRTVMRLPGSSGAINLRAAERSRMTATIANSTIINSNRQGIGAIFTGNSLVSLDFKDNDLHDIGRQGVSVRWDDDSAGTLRLTGNRIGTEAPVGTDSPRRDGIDIRARDGSGGTTRLVVHGNEVVVDSSAGEALDLDVEDGDAVVATVTDNRFVNIGGGMAFRAETEDDSATLCLDLRDNTTNDDEVGFEVIESAGLLEIRALGNSGSLLQGDGVSAYGKRCILLSK